MDIQIELIEVEDADAKLVEAWRLLAAMILDGIKPSEIIAQVEED